VKHRENSSHLHQVLQLPLGIGISSLVANSAGFFIHSQNCETILAGRLNELYDIVTHEREEQYYANNLGV
jgi:hypothetical protein